ncbi:mitotic interactor and substrate of PLK1 [Colossoma macropomum]|uniref:mitotic interactor and substrate of PLK1 n=1 Tax=Colossoma macropomum TaxID=42526 RepID=UPI001863DE37|nr:mitotic interactor and substrate of PLK1 [Colossoma macropomum]
MAPVVRQATYLSHTPQDAHNPGGVQTLSCSCHPAASPVFVPAEDRLSSRNTMGSTPKRWVMKPLMPKLEKSDLRAMLSPSSEPHSPDSSWNLRQEGGSPIFNFDNISVTRVHSSVTVSAPNGDRAQDVVLHARQVAVSEEGSATEDWQPSDPSSPGTPSSTDSHVGFYSFVDDPTSPEAERNEAYMVSPERQAKLSTLKEKSSFKLQTYVEDRRPEKLFEESNGDSCYQVEDISAEDNEEENMDRIEIIRNQAPRKNPVLKEQWSALENLDLTNSPQRLFEGFSLCYSPASPTRSQTEVEPGTIDNQQIDFNAARKQFQIMEQSKENPFRYSPQQMPHFSKLRARSLPAETGLFKKEDSTNKNFKDESSQNQSPWKKQVEEAKLTVIVHEDPEDRIQSNLIDDLDSGDQRKVFTYDRSLSGEAFMPEMRSSSPVASMSETPETPIEREIRIAREREEDLRRSRGIFRSDTSEMVEIKTKPILSQPLPELKPIKTKETNRVSFLIQQEMDKMNRSQRLSDRGTSIDLIERRNTFGSQLDEVPKRSVSVEDSWIVERPILVEQRDVPDSQEILSPCCPHRHQDETMIQKGPTVEFVDRTVRTSFYSKEGATEQQDSVTKVANQPSWMAAYKAKESGRTISPLNSPSSPAEPVRSSRSTAARRSNWESSVEWPRLLSASDIIRKEIEEDLRREQELQELREASSLSLMTDKGKGTSEPTTSEPIANNNDQTSLNSSQENLLEAVLPEKYRQRPSHSFSYSWSEETTPTRISLAGPSSRLPSVSIMAAQPWSSPKLASPAIPRAIPTVLASPRPEASSTPSSTSHKGLTETLLEDFEERRIRQKLEESSYAGIQPVDDINNEVVEATRVTRHKSTRALRWEAGEYANEGNN